MRVKILNNILNDKNSSLTIKSISALHVVKLHSLFTKKKYNFTSILLKIFKRIILNIFNFQYLIKIGCKNKKQISKKEIVIISHFVNLNHLNSKGDFYFGNLEEILKKMNKPYYKLMINHTKYSSSYLNSKIKQKNSIILDKNLNLKIESKILFKKILSVFHLIFLLFNKKLNLKRFFTIIFSLFDSSTSFSIRIHYQIKDYIKKIEPNHCILTYEGYPWERMCINGIKRTNQNIQCIGYQHAPVTHNHRAIFNHMNGSFNPDKIWCSQIKSLKILRQRIHSKIRKNIFFVGNFKKIITKKLKINNKNFFLVIPEGIYSECEKLFKFSYILAKKFKRLNFIWRVHPVIDFDKVLQNLKLTKNNLPKNITISSKKFEDDVCRCNYVIYKGSAAVIKSVIMEKYPIYFQSNYEKNFDPIIHTFKKENYVSNEENFIALLKKIKNKKYNKTFKNKVISLKKNNFSRPNLKIIKNHLSIK